MLAHPSVLFLFVFLSQCNCACLSLFVFNVCVLVLSSSSSPMSPTNTLRNRVRESRPFLIATDSICVYVCAYDFYDGSVRMWRRRCVDFVVFILLVFQFHTRFVWIFLCCCCFCLLACPIRKECQPYGRNILLVASVLVFYYLFIFIFCVLCTNPFIASIYSSVVPLLLSTFAPRLILFSVFCRAVIISRLFDIQSS